MGKINSRSSKPIIIETSVNNDSGNQFRSFIEEPIIEESIINGSITDGSIADGSRQIKHKRSLKDLINIKSTFSYQSNSKSSSQVSSRVGSQSSPPITPRPNSFHTGTFLYILEISHDEDGNAPTDQEVFDFMYNEINK